MGGLLHHSLPHQSGPTLCLKTGNAWHYSYHDKTPAYVEAENDARAAKRGLWAAPDPVNPYQWRKSKRGR